MSVFKRNALWRSSDASPSCPQAILTVRPMSTPSFQLDQRLQVLRLPQVCRITGLCRSTIYHLEACERFPRRVKVGVRSVGWMEHEIQEWLANRVRCSREHPR
jgi:prophage regulatory protein